MADTSTIDTGLNFDNSFKRELKECYVACSGEKLTSPELVLLNRTLAKELALNEDLKPEALAQLLTGSVSALESEAIAHIYAGHQFGSFNPQLGDGRAVLLGEVLTAKNDRFDIHLKGSGKTPFSRGGDGKAALGPMLREYLLGEAMHALGIPTTRGLAVTLTGEKVMRQKYHHGAVFARVASSHIRVGTFQYFAARGQQDQVKLLTDYTINRHFPELKNTDNPYKALLRAVANRQASLVAQWMLVGFVHGVMNTDNVAICGETIDFGPCAFIDEYDAKAVYSSIDRTGRYALSNQPLIAQWNITRFAECLLPLLDKNEETAIAHATEVVEDFAGVYQEQWLAGMNKKLGLNDVQDGDLDLAMALLKTMQQHKVDYTLFFRHLSESAEGNTTQIDELFKHADTWQQWYTQWLVRFNDDQRTTAQKIASMQAINPLYIPRNHLVEAAIQAAEQDLDFKPFEKLLSVLSDPYDEKSGLKEYTQGAPKDFGPYQTFCGT